MDHCSCVPIRPYAELCGEFIKEVLDHLNVNVFIYDEEPIINQGSLKKYPAHCGGLYLFYLKKKGTEAWRPIYVGATKQDFRTKFRFHADKGVIASVWSDSGVPKDHDLFAVCTHYEGASARYIKSLFLDAMNFYKNTLPARPVCFIVLFKPFLRHGEAGSNKANVSLMSLEACYPYEWMLNNWAYCWNWECIEREQKIVRGVPAERCGELFAHVFDELNCNDFLFDKEPILNVEDIKKFPANLKGFYVFYLKTSPDSNTRFPITVGVTKRSFKARFEEHAQHGVLSKWWNLNRSDMQVYVMCSHHSGPAGDFMKRFFLRTMTFPLREFGRQIRPFDFSAPLPLKAIDIPYKRFLKQMKQINKRQPQHRLTSLFNSRGEAAEN
eukprot:sb/3465635/